MSESTINRVSGEQFKIVHDLLARQDEVLEQLNALDVQVEEAIKQFVGKTEEVEAVNSEAIISPTESSQIPEPKAA